MRTRTDTHLRIADDGGGAFRRWHVGQAAGARHHVPSWRAIATPRNRRPRTALVRRVASLQGNVVRLDVAAGSDERFGRRIDRVLRQRTANPNQRGDRAVNPAVEVSRMRGSHVEIGNIDLVRCVTAAGTGIGATAVGRIGCRERHGDQTARACLGIRIVAVTAGRDDLQRTAADLHVVAKRRLGQRIGSGIGEICAHGKHAAGKAQPRRRLQRRVLCLHGSDAGPDGRDRAAGTNG